MSTSNVISGDGLQGLLDVQRVARMFWIEFVDHDCPAAVTFSLR